MNKFMKYLICTSLKNQLSICFYSINITDSFRLRKSHCWKPKSTSLSVRINSYKLNGPRPKILLTKLTTLLMKGKGLSQNQKQSEKRMRNCTSSKVCQKLIGTPVLHTVDLKATFEHRNFTFLAVWAGKQNVFFFLHCSLRSKKLFKIKVR